MSIASKLQAALIDGERPGAVLRNMWSRLENVPGGRALFSRFVGEFAPYTGTIGARIVELRLGYAKVEMEDRRRVRNHLRSVHAIALANLAEVTGNIAMAYAMPDNARFIVAGMSIDYVKKARGTITGECHCPVPEGNEKRTYEVPVVMRNSQGEEVARATLRTLIGPNSAR